MPGAEGDLSDSPPYTTDPIVVPYAINSLTAIVEFASQAGPSLTGNPYVVMQTDQGDGVWLDVAWCTITAAPAPGATTVFLLQATYNLNQGVFTGGVRMLGTNPTPNNGNNTINLCQRVRFVGKASLSSSSSSSSGTPGPTPAILVTIRYSFTAAR
jgi:hypothetical protein